MPTTLYNVPEADLALRYREPFISKGLNAKYQGVVPVGVYDGFVPQPAGALELALVPGSSGLSIAVATSSLEATYQISIQLPGTQTLDLSSLASTTVAVVLEASYSFPSVTTAILKAYNVATEAVPTYACVLATVVVPASGVIPASSISLKNRTFAWQEQSRDGIPFVSVVKNGSFDFGLAAGAAVPPFWAFTGNGTTAIDNTTKPSGTFIGNVLTYTTAGAGAATGKIRQYIGVPLGGSNGRFRMSVYFNRLVAPSSGNPVLRAEFRKTSDDTTVYAATLALTTTGTYQTTLDLDDITTLQNVGNYLAFVEVDANSANYGSAAPVFYITSIEVDIEAPAGGAIDALLEATGEKRLTKLTLIDPANQSAGGSSSDLTYDQATDKVNISSSFGVDDNLSVTGTSAFTGATTHTGGVRTPSVDSIGATALTIGPTNQTGLTVGRVGATTEVRGSTTSIGVNASDGNVTIGRTGSTTAIDSATANIGASGSGTTTVRSAATVVSGTANVVGNFSVATSQFTVAAATGNTAVAGTLAVTGITTATGAINANGGIGRSTSGTLAVGNDADVTLISIGTASSTGGVGISQSGQTTTIYGDLVVNGTASLGAVTISGVDSAAAGGTVNIGTTNAGFVDIGNVANSTTTRVLGPVLLNDALATKSRIDRGNAGTLLIGSSNETTGAGTATSVFLGRAPNSGGTTTSIDGATINVGGNSNTPYASTIAIGTQTPTTATITVGNAPTAGTVTTTVQGNTLNLGTDADAATISIGTSSPTSTRTISIGANVSGQTTTLSGSTVNVGGSATTSLVVGASTAGAGTNTTRLRGDIITIGDEANTNSVTLGDGNSGKVRTRHLDGNGGQLSLGTDTTQTTTDVTLGRLGIPVYVRGSTVYLDPVGSPATLDAGPNASTVFLGYNCTDTNIANNAASGTITIGPYGVNTLDTRIYGQEIYADSPNTSKILLGNNTSGQMRVHGYLDGNVGGLSLGTNAAATSGNVSIGHGAIGTYVNSPLYLATATLDRSTGAALDIGTANAAAITLGRSGQSLTINSSSIDINGGTQTAATPLVDISGTWNTVGGTFIGLKMDITDTASAAGADFVSLRVSGVPQLRIQKDGSLVALGTISSTSSISGSTVTCTTLNINGTTVPEPVYGALKTSTSTNSTLSALGTTRVLLANPSHTFDGTNCAYSSLYNGVQLNGLTGWTGYVSFYYTISIDVSSNTASGTGLKLALMRSTSLTNAPSIMVEEQVYFANAVVSSPQLLTLTALFGRISLSTSTPYNWGVAMSAQANSYATIYYSGQTLIFHSH